METLDKESPVPIYHQLRRIILRNIESGVWNQRESIPSERELSEQFSVSRMTIRQALAELSNQGVLRREIGKGTFVAEPRITQTLSHLTGFSAEMRARGHRPATRVIALEMRPASAEAARALNIEEGTPLVVVERIRLADDDPIALEASHVRFDGCQQLLSENLSRSLYELLESKHGVVPTRARQHIGAGLCGPREASLLGIATGSAVLSLQRTVFDQNDRPFEYVESTYRGDRYTFDVELLNPSSRSGGSQ